MIQDDGDGLVALLTVSFHVLLPHLPGVAVFRFNAAGRGRGVLNPQQDRTAAALGHIRTGIVAAFPLTTARTKLQLPIAVVCAEVTLSSDRVEFLLRIFRRLVAALRVQRRIFRCVRVHIRERFGAAALASRVTQVSPGKEGVSAGVGCRLGVVETVHPSGGGVYV